MTRSTSFPASVMISAALFFGCVLMLYFASFSVGLAMLQGILLAVCVGVFRAEAVCVSIVLVVCNNFLVLLLVSLLGLVPNKLSFAVPTFVILLSSLSILISSIARLDQFLKVCLCYFILISLLAFFSVFFNGFVAILSARNTLMVGAILMLGYCARREKILGLSSLALLFSFFLSVNLAFQVLELIFQEDLWGLLAYEMVLREKGVGMGVFFTHMAIVGGIIRNGGIYLEPVNLGLASSFLIPAIMLLGSRKSVFFMVVTAILVTVLTAGKGGYLSVALIPLLLAVGLIFGAKTLVYMLPFCWGLASISSSILVAYMGKLSTVVVPHLVAISSIYSVLTSKYALLGHGFGSSGAFNSMEQESASLDAVVAIGGESGVASLIYQVGVVGVTLVLALLFAICRAIESAVEDRLKRVLFVCCAVLPWYAALWQENALSLQAIVLPYFGFGVLLAHEIYNLE